MIIDECERDCVLVADPDEDDPENDMYFRRVCPACAREWYALHCPHDGHQNPCPWCLVRPEPVLLEGASE